MNDVALVSHLLTARPELFANQYIMSANPGQRSSAGSAAYLNTRNVSCPVYSNRVSRFKKRLEDRTRRTRLVNGPIQRREVYLASVTGSWLGESGDVREPSHPYYDEVTRAIAVEPSYNRELLFDLFEAAQMAGQSHEQKSLEMIQHRKPVQKLRAFLNGMLANAELSELNDQIIGRLSSARRRTDIESNVPRARPRVMDIQYLCGIAPYSVPANPWTTVTDSDDLVSHLVSLYLTWGYPFYAFFCRETFVKHMRSGQLNSDFCSPFLVNALLANACVSDDPNTSAWINTPNPIQFYSDYSEAYSLPGDVKRKGTHFLAEAERHLKSHQFESGSDVRIASLQASLLLYER